MLGRVQVAVVDLGSDPQDVAHQGVDVHRLEGPHLQVLPEDWTHGPEEGLHVQVVVVEAVLSLVGLHWEELEERQDGANGKWTAFIQCFLTIGGSKRITTLANIHIYARFHTFTHRRR